MNHTPNDPIGGKKLLQFGRRGAYLFKWGWLKPPSRWATSLAPIKVDITDVRRRRLQWYYASVMAAVGVFLVKGMSANGYSP